MNDLMCDGGYGIRWNDIRTYSCDGYRPRMSDYHIHTYYEISLLLCGNMSVFFSDVRFDNGNDARVVLMKPFVPHYITPKNNKYYKHINVEFSPDLLCGMPDEFTKLLSVFGENGTVIGIDNETCELLSGLSERLEKSANLTEKKIILLDFLSVINEKKKEDASEKSPVYIAEALRYISDNFSKKLKAENISEKAGVGRTTLMVNFKKYTGVTVNEYLIRCRINHAAGMMCAGASEEESASACGFGSVSNMIHSFRKISGMTPKKYINKYVHGDSF